MKKVLIILPNGFEIFEAAAFIDVLGWADAFGDTRIEVVKAGVSSGARCTFGGFDITFNQILSDLDLSSFDAVAIPGGFEKSGYYKEAFSESVINALKEFNRTKRPIASICVGALPIAKSGALKGRKATTYHLDDGKWRQKLMDFGVEVVDASVVTDSNIITSTSPGTALEVAFLLLENLTSKKNCQYIKKQMGFNEKDLCITA